MAEKTELVIKINGDIKGYNEALKSVSKETEDLQNQLNSIAKVGAVAFAGLGAATVLAAKQFSEFQNDLLAVKTLLDEASFGAVGLEEGFRNLTKGALKTFRDLPIEVDSLNKSLFDIVSAGVDASKSLDVLGSSGRLAIAGVTDVAIATDGVTSALNSYSLSAEKSEEVAAKFFTAQKFGKTTIEDLSNFFGRAASSASAFNVSLDELLAAVAAATVGGIKTEAAFTGITAILSNVARPTKRAREEAERLGVTFDSTALRAKGLNGFLNSLTESTKFNQTSVERLFRSVEAQKIIYALTGSQAEKFKQTLDALGDSQQILTTFTRAYEEQSKSLKNQVKIMDNNFKALGIVIGEKVEPFMRMLASTVTELLKFIHENPGLTNFIAKMLVAGTVTAGLTTSVALAASIFLKFRASLIASSIATRGLSFAVKGLVGSTGFGLLIAFLPELLDMFQTVFSGIKNIVEKTGGSISKALGGLGNILKGVFTFDLSLIKKGLSGFKEAFSEVADEAVKEFSGANKKVVKDAKKTGEDLRGSWEKQIADKKETVEESKKIDEEKAANDKKGLEKRKAALQREQELLKAANQGLEREQISFIKRKQDLEVEASKAKEIADIEERALALQNVELKNQQILADEQKFLRKKVDLAAKEKKIAEEKAVAEQEAADKRREELQAENERLKAHQEGLSEEERGFLERRQSLKEEFAEASAIKDEEERTLALENVQLQNEQLLEEERLFYEERDALRAEQQEREFALQEELNQLSKDQRDALQKEELDSLKKSLVTKEKARSKAVKEEIVARRKENEIFRKDEEAHGWLIAHFKKMMRNEDVKGFRETADSLSALQNSENTKLKNIGKAAALVQIAMSTAEGAIKAYTSLAGIPFVGPALGAAAAGALIAYGGERAAQVRAAQTGGIVEGVGFGDKMPFLLEPGELIAPRQNFDEVVNAVANARIAEDEGEEFEGEGGAGEQTILIGFDGEEAADVLTLKQNESRILGFSQEI